VTLNDLERRSPDFPELDRLGGRLLRTLTVEGGHQCRIFFSYISAKTGPRSSRTVSLRQLSFLFHVGIWKDHTLLVATLLGVGTWQ